LVQKTVALFFFSGWVFSNSSLAFWDIFIIAASRVCACSLSVWIDLSFYFALLSKSVWWPQIRLALHNWLYGRRFLRGRGCILSAHSRVLRSVGFVYKSVCNASFFLIIHKSRYLMIRIIRSNEHILTIAHHRSHNSSVFWPSEGYFCQRSPCGITPFLTYSKWRCTGGF
jgi:hypothetical protein